MSDTGSLTIQDVLILIVLFFIGFLLAAWIGRAIGRILLKRKKRTLKQL